MTNEELDDLIGEITQGSPIDFDLDDSIPNEHMEGSSNLSDENGAFSLPNLHSDVLCRDDFSVNQENVVDFTFTAEELLDF